MRIWSLHPQYLDTKGIVALWRETLLAQKVLEGKTKGYTRHPQLQRFKACSNPLGAIARYLRVVADEADRRGYNFDRSKINPKNFRGQISVTSGQIAHERDHLLGKLAIRDPEAKEVLARLQHPDIHPLFKKVRGKVESWEVVDK